MIWKRPRLGGPSDERKRKRAGKKKRRNPPLGEGGWIAGPPEREGGAPHQGNYPEKKKEDENLATLPKKGLPEQVGKCGGFGEKKKGAWTERNSYEEKKRNNSDRRKG